MVNENVREKMKRKREKELTATWGEETLQGILRTKIHLRRR